MDWLLPASLLAAAAGVIALRLGWGRGGAAATVAGWGAIIAAVAGGTVLAGAWGIAMAAVAAVAAALALIAQAAWATPATAGRPPRESPAVALPRQELGAILRRVGVFALVGPLGLAASAVLAMGLGETARAGGWHDADSTSLVVFATAIAWTLLATWQMLRPTRKAMILPALLVAATGAVLWGLA